MELRISDLRFTAAETVEYLNNKMKLSLTEKDIKALESRTEGWIARLQLAALSMQGNENYSSFIDSFTGSHQFILDYLLEEVLQQTNLFIIPLDNERKWYRYHHLFADLLRQRLESEKQSTAAGLHLSVSKWFNDNGFRWKAIHHALAGSHFKTAADLIEKIWPEMDESFQPAQWLIWANSLPQDIFKNRPVLNTAFGWVLLNKGNIENCEEYFSTAEQLAQELEKDQSTEIIICDEQ